MFQTFKIHREILKRTLQDLRVPESDMCYLTMLSLMSIFVKLLTVDNDIRKLSLFGITLPSIKGCCTVCMNPTLCTLRPTPLHQSSLLIRCLFLTNSASKNNSPKKAFRDIQVPLLSSWIYMILNKITDVSLGNVLF